MIVAVTVTQKFLGTNISVNDITATSDADVVATIPLPLGSGQQLGGLTPVAPAEVYLTPMLSQALTAMSAWVWAWVLAPGAITLSKQTSTGSGNAAVQLRCVIKSPQAPNAVGSASQIQPLGL